MSQISSFDIAALKVQYDSIRKPLPLWLCNLDAVVPEIEVGTEPAKFKIGFGAFCKNLTAGERFKYAAWKWIRPHGPHYGVTDLGGIQQLAGLDSVGYTEFVRRLRENCVEIQRGHEDLSKWIQRRISLLDYASPGAQPVPEELEVAEVSLRYGVEEAMNFLWQDKDMAITKASYVSQLALTAASTAVHHVLGNSKCRMSANLMVPVRTDGDSPTLIGSQLVQANCASANALWNGLSADRYLLLVSETRTQHEGFWIPLARGDGNTFIPGAPAAFENLTGSAVFKNDPPPFEGFTTQLKTRWASYITNAFQQRMFVSLPFIVRDGHEKIVPAVLNINADPSEQDGWIRAHHLEWLEKARIYAAPFIEVAYKAFLIKSMAMNKIGNITIDTGSGNWNYIAGVTPNSILLLGNRGGGNDSL